MYAKVSLAYLSSHAASDVKFEIVLTRIIDEYSMLKGANLEDTYLRLSPLTMGRLSLRSTKITIQVEAKPFPINKSRNSAPAIPVEEPMERLLWLHVIKRLRNHVHTRKVMEAYTDVQAAEPKV